MWASLNPRFKNIVKLRSIAVGFFAVAFGITLFSLVNTHVAHAADLSGEWVKTDEGLTAVRVGSSLYFNPGKEGTHWYMTENAAGVFCQSKIEFSDDPRTNADAAKSATQRFFRETAEGAGTRGCTEKLGDANKVTITGSPTSTTTDPGDTSGQGSSTANDKVCTVGALGWVICPLINFMGTASDQASAILRSILFVQPLNLDTSDDKNHLYKAWAGILGVANVLLAIAFLYVIFAQATSVGLSSYGVKKMLPRIIAAAILMNLSYYICAIAVDLSNLAGVGITGILMGATSGTFNGELFQPDTFTSKFGNSGITEAIAGIGVGAIIVIWFLVPVLLGILAVLFTLAARLALIVLLVMIAPVAFAAWILPNTEKYFKKWYEWFFNMLMLFPLIMAVFAGATIASKMVIESATIEESTATGITDAASAKVFLPLIGLLIQALPLFALPFLFKAAGGVLGKINAMAHSAGYNRLGGKQLEGGLAGARKGAANFGKGVRQNAMRNLGAKMAAGEVGGRAGRFVGGYKARRERRLSENEKSAKLAQEDAVNDTLLHNDNYARRTSGVAGEEGIERVRSAAIDSVMRRGNERKENTEKMQQAFARLSPFAAQAFADSVDDEGVFSPDKLQGEIARRRALGQLNENDAQELNRVQPLGSAFTAAAMSGAVGSLARSGFLENRHIRSASNAITSSGMSDAEKEVSLDRMADNINSAAKESGMAQHMRWGVVGGHLIQNGQDIDLGGIGERIRNNDPSISTALRNAYSTYEGINIDDPSITPEERATRTATKTAALTTVMKEFETSYQTPLGFQKLGSAANISRKAFMQIKGKDAQGRDIDVDEGGNAAFTYTMTNNEGFKEDVFLTASGARGAQMNAQDREELKVQAQAFVVGRSAKDVKKNKLSAAEETTWQNAVNDAKKRAGLFTGGNGNGNGGGNPPSNGNPPSSPSGNPPSGGTPSNSGGGSTTFTGPGAAWVAMNNPTPPPNNPGNSGQSPSNNTSQNTSTFTGPGAAWVATNNPPQANPTNVGQPSQSAPSSGTSSARQSTSTPPPFTPPSNSAPRSSSSSFSTSTPPSGGGSSTWWSRGGGSYGQTANPPGSVPAPSPNIAPATTRVEFLGTIPDQPQRPPRPNGPLEITTGRSSFDNPPTPPTPPSNNNNNQNP